MNAARRDEDVFADVIARPAHDRAAFLEVACHGDQALRERILALLAAHAGPESLLRGSAPPREILHEEKPGDAIGHYKLLQKIGEGGCGVVWMAEQEEPVRRRVALKVIKLGMDTKAVVARFEAERQALAMMDHPNIAKVHDAGATETGRPFFVMELVRGIPITKYCDENHLTPQERLELFIKVCQAIQHAHQKGVIHRDIKPSNILVTVNDGAPTPKVIDFGIAKATQGRLTDATVFTAFEQFIGTPEYMSPEQAEMSSLDIDTRADIYSLGVLLYELLTGRLPFDPNVFVQGGVDQIRRQIRELDPPKPSKRLHTLDDEERTTIARLRNTAPAQLSIVLRGDLDWIVMRCLEKDRTRRYETANGLAMDIRRYLRNEPIVARPPSTTYLMQKLVRRNRVAFAGVVSVACVLIIGAAVSTWQAIRATVAEREKTRLHGEAEQSRANEAELRRIAEKQELIARQRAYAADMNLVRYALDTDNLGRAQSLLNHHRPLLGQRDLRGWEWRYLRQLVRNDYLLELDQRRFSVSALSVSADGNTVAIGEFEEGGLVLLDPRFRTQTRVPAGQGYVRVAFSPQGSLLAMSTENFTPAGGWRHAVHVVSTSTHQVVKTFDLDGPCRGISFSEDGTKLVTAACEPDDQIALWQVSEGRKIAGVSAKLPLIYHGNPFAATRSLNLVAHAIRHTGDFRVVDVMTGLPRFQIKGAHERVQALAFSADGKLLATGGAFVDSSIRLWDVESGTEIGRLEGHRSWVCSLLFWPDGRTLASASADQTIRLWDVREQRLQKTLRGHKRGAFQLALLPDARTLISGGEDGATYVWDTATPPENRSTVTLDRRIAVWRFSPDSKSLVTVDHGGTVETWEGASFENRREIMRLATTDPGATPLPDLSELGAWRYVRLSPTEPLVAVGSVNGIVRIWDIERRRLMHELRVSNGPVLPEQFFSNGRRLVVRDDARATMRDWDLTSGREIASWQIPESTNHFLWKAGVAFSPQEDQCITLGWSGNAVIRDMVTGRVLRHDFKIKEAADPKFSFDGKYIIAACGVGGANVWNAQTFQPIASLSGFLRNVYSVDMSPDGQRLAAGSNGSESVKLWDMESHQEVLLLQGEGALFRRTAFSPDGNIIGSVNDAGILHLWRAPSWAEIEAAENSERALSRKP